MRILLVEPYCAGSHRAWAEGFASHSGHQVELLTLPGRFWKWRMQGGAVTLAERARDLGCVPDLVFASGMLNLPVFLALAGASLGGGPAAVYLHENQLTYPPPPGEKRDLTYGMINWLSMLAARRIFFNSSYHLRAWFDELPRMLKHFPDCDHLALVDRVREKAAVLGVGCDLRRLDGDGEDVLPEAGTAPLVLWNQRWEYDKAPGTFLKALVALAGEGLEFRVALAGPSRRQETPQFDKAREGLGDRVIQFGYAEEERYVRLLRRSDVVVSTARHEFFGVSIVEAIYAGCFPVLPNRLSYPELIPPEHHHHCLYEGFAGLLERLRWALSHTEEAAVLAADLRPAVARFDWGEMGPVYDRALAEAAEIS
jgi:glycosyltransferase involved in cell wall biosynthesis